MRFENSTRCLEALTSTRCRHCWHPRLHLGGGLLVDVKNFGHRSFDDETANELQKPAREYLEQLESELETNVRNSAWMTLWKTVPATSRCCEFGENDIKRWKTLPVVATDDLVVGRQQGRKRADKHPAFSMQ